MSVTKNIYGVTNGKEVKAFIIENKNGLKAQLIEKGATLDKLFIKDYGCGIKAEDIPHAFDRFYKARNEKNKSGSGLGLAIAKQIALRHDMSLELESEQGVYTKITVNLPPKEKVE